MFIREQFAFADEMNKQFMDSVEWGDSYESLCCQVYGA